MNAAGRTVTAAEIVAELRRVDPTTPIRIASADVDDEGFAVHALTGGSTAITLHTDPDALLTDEHELAVDLLRRYLAKFLTAAQLRREAAEFLTPAEQEATL
jgi:dihydroxyacid dehydratase/phosphogluconate dehydratase